MKNLILIAALISIAMTLGGLISFNVGMMYQDYQSCKSDRAAWQKPILGTDE